VIAGAPSGTQRRLAHAGVLLVSAAGTAGLLALPPSAPADQTFPLLMTALIPLAAFMLLEQRALVTARSTVVTLAIALLVLAVIEPPHGSHDVWSYAFYGRMLVAHHLSPYTHRPADLPSDPLLARVAPGWRAAKSVYGPGFTTLSAGVMAMAGTSALAARLGFQGLAALAVLAAAVLLARRRVPPAALAAVLLNPVLVVAVVNGGHNDALVGLALLAAALALRRGRWAAGGLWTGAAFLTKAVAALPAVVVVAWVWRQMGVRPAKTVIATMAGPVVVGYVAFGGLGAIAPVLAAGSRRSRTSIWGLLAPSHSAVFAAAAVVMLTAAVVAPRIKWEPVETALLGSLAGYLLAASYVLPWYFGWILPVAALDLRSLVARLLVAQTVVMLIAYQYQPTRHSDGLDHVLHTGVVTAQVVALAIAVVLVVRGLTVKRAAPSDHAVAT
jgi:hypothetical protein